MEKYAKHICTPNNVQRLLKSEKFSTGRLCGHSLPLFHEEDDSIGRNSRSYNQFVWPSRPMRPQTDWNLVDRQCSGNGVASCADLLNPPALPDGCVRLMGS